MGDHRKMSIYRARSRLVWLWFLGSLFPVSLLVVRSVIGHYEPDTRGVWEWFLPTLLPTFMLIWSVFFSGSRPDTEADKGAFWLSWWASALYIVLVLASIVADAFNSKTPIEMVRVSNLWLGPAQGVVAMAIGMFFIRNIGGDKGKKEEDDPSGVP